jgi:hypothetical protein
VAPEAASFSIIQGGVARVAETNTGGGASIGGNVESGGGNVTGRDNIEQSVYVKIEKDSLDDVRTDIRFIKDDIGDLKFAQFEMRSEIRQLQGQPATHTQREMSERTIRLLAMIFAVIVIATFIMLLYAAVRGVVGH